MKITLANLHEATKQQVFDQVATHLLEQQKTSVNSDELCVYHNKSGDMCAAGCLISKEEYKKSFELKDWGELVEEKSVPNVHIQLISNLQDVHDFFEVEEWFDTLKSLALEQKLKTTVLYQYK